MPCACSLDWSSADVSSGPLSLAVANASWASSMGPSSMANSGVSRFFAGAGCGGLLNFDAESFFVDASAVGGNDIFCIVGGFGFLSAHEAESCFIGEFCAAINAKHRITPSQ